MQSKMESGYDVPFTSEIESRFQCPICLLVLREPMQTACGHRFCDGCIRRVIVTNNVLTCPVDKQYSRVNQMFPDVAIQREILSLSVQCPNTDDGCAWRGELRELEKHREVCRMEEVHCPHGCELTTKRCQLDDHVTVCPSRQVQCKHCQEHVIYQNLEKHTENCPKAFVTCEVCGVVSLPREDLDKHIHPSTGTCEKVVVVCPYSDFGCSYKEERSKMKHHEESTEVMRRHMELARFKLSKHEQTITDLLDTVAKITKTTDELLPIVRENQQRHVQISRDLIERNVTGRVHWKIKIGGQRRQRGSYQSPIFCTGCPGYKVQLTLELDGHRENANRYSSLHLSLLAGDYDEQLIFPFNATCLVTLYDQFNSVSRRSNFSSTLVVREVPRVVRPGLSGDRIYRRGISKFMKRQELVGAGSRFFRQGALHMEVTVMHCFYPPPELTQSPTCSSSLLSHSPLSHNPLPLSQHVTSPHPQGSPVLSVASLTIGN
ncbi:TNF receptor-associated factor 6 [Aplysia californica]|uniref:TNF receptor-associated factor 6 n=1 Tax=Aplysia californica TaxID=6500 RepID=A0ABM0JD88_APLCA|nr:TNF receptor-associated factor 6 [Aplysia californica]